MVWIPDPEIHYHVAIDGLSLWLVVLTTLLTPVAVLLSWQSIQVRAKEFFACLLLLEFGLIGVFIAFDLFLYYTFWEIVLVPMYLIIGIWGGEKRSTPQSSSSSTPSLGSVLMLARSSISPASPAPRTTRILWTGSANGKICSRRARQNAALPRFLLRVRDQIGSVPPSYVAARRV